MIFTDILYQKRNNKYKKIHLRTICKIMKRDSVFMDRKNQFFPNGSTHITKFFHEYQQTDSKVYTEKQQTLDNRQNTEQKAAAWGIL